MLTPSSGSMTSLSPSSTVSKRAGASVLAMSLAYARVRWFRLGEEAVVTLVFEAIGQLRAALLRNSAIHEDVDEVGADVAEDAGVMGDQQDAEPGVGMRAVDAL